MENRTSALEKFASWTPKTEYFKEKRQRILAFAQNPALPITLKEQVSQPIQPPAETPLAISEPDWEAFVSSVISPTEQPTEPVKPIPAWIMEKAAVFEESTS